MEHETMTRDEMLTYELGINTNNFNRLNKTVTYNPRCRVLVNYQDSTPISYSSVKLSPKINQRNHSRYSNPQKHYCNSQCFKILYKRH